MRFNQAVSIAPMMDWTDRHYRYFMRLISRHVVLYTEMITTGALLHGDAERFLRYDMSEHPVVIQLGGSEPGELAQCAKLAEQAGYDAVNLNVGCPSDRVQSGRFGACLMKEPNTVAAGVAAMCDVVDIPVTVKTRIGVDDNDSYAELVSFIETVNRAGCDTFILHARKAWLKGLSPKQNRDIPPLRYDVVEQLKRDFPTLNIQINGGIKDLITAKSIHANLDGIMIGREAYQHPYCMSTVDRDYFNDPSPIPTREAVIHMLLPYIETCLSEGLPLTRVTRHILGLFHEQPGAKHWRRYLSQEAHKPSANTETVVKALALMQHAAEESPLIST